MLAKKYPDMEKPVYCAKKMSLFEYWRDIRFHQNLWKVDERMRELYLQTEFKDECMAEGRAEGLAEGEQKKSREIALKMKNAGKPFSEISEFTGLSLKTIEEL